LENIVHLLMDRLDDKFVGAGFQAGGNATGQKADPFLERGILIFNSGRQSKDVLGHGVGNVKDGVRMFGELFSRVLKLPI
jgi:hypothetical protein